MEDTKHVKKYFHGNLWAHYLWIRPSGGVSLSQDQKYDSKRGKIIKLIVINMTNIFYDFSSNFAEQSVSRIGKNSYIQQCTFT